MNTPSDKQFRVYKCRHKNCGSDWVEESGRPDPRCLVCGGTIPYSTVPMSEPLALMTLLRQGERALIYPNIKSVEKEAINRLQRRNNEEESKIKTQIDDFRIFYGVLQQRVMK